MKTFQLYSLDGWVQVPINQDVAYETGENVRNIEVTYNANDFVEVWAVDPDDELSAVLVAAASGMFVAKLALPANMCLRVSGPEGVAVFARSSARSQVIPPSCDPSLTRPMPPRTQIDPRVKAMMDTMRRNEVLRQQAFQDMLSRAAPGAAPAASAGAAQAASAAAPADPSAVATGKPGAKGADDAS